MCQSSTYIVLKFIKHKLFELGELENLKNVGWTRFLKTYFYHLEKVGKRHFQNMRPFFITGIYEFLNVVKSLLNSVKLQTNYKQFVVVTIFFRPSLNFFTSFTRGLSFIIRNFACLW